MSRLLFAAARGARVERAHFISPTDWEPSRLAWVETPKESDYDYRIHPDDEHLQYGPISSALREAAEAGNRWDLTGWHGRMADAAATYQAAWWYASEPVRTLYLLILSECLADEGL